MEQQDIKIIQQPGQPPLAIPPRVSRPQQEQLDVAGQPMTMHAPRFTTYPLQQPSQQQEGSQK